MLETELYNLVCCTWKFVEVNRMPRTFDELVLECLYRWVFIRYLYSRLQDRLRKKNVNRTLSFIPTNRYDDEAWIWGGYFQLMWAKGSLLTLTWWHERTTTEMYSKPNLLEQFAGIRSSCACLDLQKLWDNYEYTKSINSHGLENRCSSSASHSNLVRSPVHRVSV